MADISEFLNWIETSTEQVLNKSRNSEEQVIPSIFNVKKLRRQFITKNVIVGAKQISLKYTPLLAWITHRKGQPIPDSFKYKDFQYKGYKINTPIFYWIRYRLNEPIPADLLYDGVNGQYDLHGDNAINCWIRYRPDEPIPDCLKYDGWEETCGKYLSMSPIIAWIKYTDKSLPHQLIYNRFQEWHCVAEVNFVNNRTRKVYVNPVLLWVISRPGQPISPLLPDAQTFYDNMQERYTKSFALQQLGDIVVSWILHSKTLPPENLRYQNWNQLRDSIRDTPLMAWIQSSDPDRAEIPEELLYKNVQRATNLYGDTALTLWLQYKSPHIAIPRQIIYKQHATPQLIEVWEKYRPNQPLPGFIIMPQVAQDIHQCCICYNENITTYYTCEHQHPDAAVCGMCYAELRRTSKYCPVCRAKLL